MAVHSNGSRPLALRIHQAKPSPLMLGQITRSLAAWLAKINATHDQSQRGTARPEKKVRDSGGSSNGTPLCSPTTGPLRRLKGVAQSLRTPNFKLLFLHIRPHLASERHHGLAIQTASKQGTWNRPARSRLRIFYEIFFLHQRLMTSALSSPHSRKGPSRPAHPCSQTGADTEAP